MLEDMKPPLQFEGSVALNNGPLSEICTKLFRLQQKINHQKNRRIFLFNISQPQQIIRFIFKNKVDVWIILVFHTVSLNCKLFSMKTRFGKILTRTVLPLAVYEVKISLS